MNEAVEVKKIGIKESKEMLVFLFMLAKVAKEAKENDGKITYMDSVLLMKVVPSLGPAIENADLILAEIKDLDDAEINELINFLAIEVGGVFTEEKLIGQIIAGLNVAKSLNAFIQTF